MATYAERKTTVAEVIAHDFQTHVFNPNWVDAQRIAEAVLDALDHMPERVR